MTTPICIKNLTAFPKAVPTGLRLARLIRKQTKEEKLAGIVPQASQGCYVPEISRNLFDVVAMSEEGQDYLFSILAGIQNNILREAIAEDKQINEQTISAAAIIRWLGDNAEESIRLSEKAVTDWFVLVAKPIIVANFVATRGLTSEVAEPVARNYLPYFRQATSSNATFPTEEVMHKVKAIMLVIAEEDSGAVTQKMLRRITEMRVIESNLL